MNWVGNKFDPKNPNRYDRRWICQEIRKDLKEAFGKEWKITVRKDSWNSIELTIRKCPAEFLTEEARNMKDFAFALNAQKYIDESIVNKIANIANAYNYDNSDGMTDYFDRNYYLHVGIDFNKQFWK